MTLAQYDTVAQTVLLLDEQITLNDGEFVPCYDPASRVHTGGTNYNFLDGHSKWLRPETLRLNATDTLPSGGGPSGIYAPYAGYIPAIPGTSCIPPAP